MGILCVKFVFKKDSLWLICSLDSHFSTYWDLYLAKIISLYSLLTNLWRFHMVPSCVAERTLADQYGVEWTVCMYGVGVS